MSLLLRSSRRWLLRHPAQLSLSVLGVALGVAVVVAMDLAIESSREAFRASAAAVAGNASHHVMAGPGGLPDTVFTALRLQVGIPGAAPVVEGHVEAPVLGARPFLLLGIDPLSEAPFRPWASGGGTGMDLAAFLTGGAGVLLSGQAAREAGIGPGEPLEVTAGGRSATLRVAGLLEAQGELARRGLRDVLVVDVSRAQILLGREGRLDRIDLTVPEGPAGDSALAGVRGALPPTARVEPAGTRARTMAEMIRAFDLNLTALSLLALVFGMFLIYNTMTFSVVARRELLGTYRALGVTRRGVLGLVLGEAMLVGVVGTGVGLLLGVVLGRGLVELVTRTINDLYFVLSVEGLAMPPRVLVRGTLLGIGATVAAALPAAREASSSTPRSAMTRSVLESSARGRAPGAAVVGVGLLVGGGGLLLLPSRSVVLGFAALFAAVLGMALLVPMATVGFVRLVRPVLGKVVGILGSMAARGVEASLSRTGPAVAALMVAVSVTVGLGVMIGSFRSTLVRWLEGTLQADVYVSAPSTISSRPVGSLDPDLPRVLEGVEGVVGVSRYRSTELRTDEGPLRLVALDLHPRGEGAFDFAGGEPREAFRAFRREGAVLISEPLAYRRGLEAGDTLLLPTERGGRPFPVAGVYYDYGSDRGVVTLSEASYDRFWPDRDVTSLGIFADPGTGVDELAERLRRAAAGAGGPSVVIRSNRALRAASLRVFDRTFQVTSVLRLLAFLVAFIGILSALMALQLERGRELGVLRANGMTPGQVWHLVTAQTGIMGLVAGLLAVPAGLVLATVMIFVVNRRSFGWTLRMEVGPELILQAVGLALVGALLAGLYPAWKMARTSPARALRHE